jgi:hypothetical protein
MLRSGLHCRTGKGSVRKGSLAGDPCRRWDPFGQALRHADPRGMVRQECSDPWNHLAEPFLAEVVQKPLMSSVVIYPNHVKKSYAVNWQPYSPRSVDPIQQDLNCVACRDTPAAIQVGWG